MNDKKQEPVAYVLPAAAVYRLRAVLVWAGVMADRLAPPDMQALSEQLIQARPLYQKPGGGLCDLPPSVESAPIEGEKE